MFVPVIKIDVILVCQKVRICVKSNKACFVVVFYSGDNFLTKIVAICLF